MNEVQINYTPAKTIAKFHADNSDVRGLMGPIGSGKSVACVLEILDRSMKQSPGPDGVRRTRWGVIRNSYPELKSTTIKTFEEWVPSAICRIKYDTPITARLYHKLPDGTIIDMEVIFASVDKPKDTRKLLSLELTGVWMNETRELSKKTLDMAFGRTGRYPSKRLGGPDWSGVIMDTNPPDDDHWWYDLVEKKKPSNYNFYKQPPAIRKVNGIWEGHPDAENVEHQPLGYRYWLRQVEGKDDDWIKVYLLGQYGSLQDGRPVYPEFNDYLHVAKEPLKPIPQTPIAISFDFGLTPACVIQQVGPNGRMYDLDEIVTPKDKTMSLKEFCRDLLKPFLAQHYKQWPISMIPIPCDPAGLQKAQSDAGTCVKVLRDAGFKRVLPARTNSPLARVNAVKSFLTRMIDGQPGYLISPTCKNLRKGYNGGYKYRRIQVSGEEKFTDKPEKNFYSHVADAKQYGALYFTNDEDNKNDRPRQAVAETDDSPLSNKLHGGRQTIAEAGNVFR